MTDRLPEADIVISSTASRLPILGKRAVEEAVRARRYRAMLMIDLAVPRDIEPQVASLSDIYLYTVDDLREVVQENVKARASRRVRPTKLWAGIVDVEANYAAGLS